MTRHLSPAALGRWSARHPWLAIGLWLAFVAAAVFALALSGTKQLQDGAVGQSARGDTALNTHDVGFPPQAYAYLHSDSLRAGSPVFRAAIKQVAERMHKAARYPVSVTVSADGHWALVSTTFTHQFAVTPLERAVAAAGTPRIDAVLVGGVPSSGSDLKRAEELSVPVTLLVLLLAFGAVVAALVPVLLAATAVIASFGLLGPISHAFPLDSSVKTVVLLIGMAVGVDYALFYVIRSREERRRGAPSHEALERTARTSGRTVVIAGTTVAIAMAGQYAIGSNIFNGIASGTIAVVACSVIGSVTVLPAVLELLGSRIDRGRIPFLPSLKAGSAESRFWPAVTERVLRRPLLAAALATALLVALALPALGLHVAKPSDAALASGGDSTLGRELTAAFPAMSSPAVVVATFPRAQRDAAERELRRLEQRAAALGIAHPPFQNSASQDGRALAAQLPLTGFGDNAASREAIATLRRQLIPQTLGQIPGVTTDVTGDTAQDVDFTSQMKHGVPYVVGFVLALAFLLLLASFRSIVVPLKAMVLNLLSVAASLGVLVLVFQRHWAQGLLGFHSNGAIISWLPLFLFVVLFGLSMDYHVFILSRIREGVDSGLSTDDAIRDGVGRSAGVVTSAALVMVGVFLLFATSNSLDLKQAGVGLAAAVLIDATVIRGVLLPATMKLLGERNWYLPRWLERLPHLEKDRLPELPAPAAD
jgi:RND superfamily putative drug exporter